MVGKTEARGRGCRILPFRLQEAAHRPPQGDGLHLHLEFVGEEAVEALEAASPAAQVDLSDRQIQGLRYAQQALPDASHDRAECLYEQGGDPFLLRIAARRGGGLEVGLLLLLLPCQRRGKLEAVQDRLREGRGSRGPGPAVPYVPIVDHAQGRLALPEVQDRERLVLVRGHFFP